MFGVFAVKAISIGFIPDRCFPLERFPLRRFSVKHYFGTTFIVIYLYNCCIDC